MYQCRVVQAMVGCLVLYLVDGGSVGIGKVFDVAASISASNCEVFIIVFDMS